MKRNTFMVPEHKLFFHAPLIVLAIALILGSCKKEAFNRNAEDCSQPNTTTAKTLSTIPPCGTPLVVNLMAGQNTDIGSVQVHNTEDSLYITITSEGSWWVQAANVYVGPLSGMPQTQNGNPKVGHFPYKKVLNPMRQVVQFAIPLTGLPACYIAAIHVEARRVVNGQIAQSETGWGQGTPMSGGNWAMYVPYCTQECEEPCAYGTDHTVMYAGQTMYAGDIAVTNDADSIYVTIQMKPEWYMQHIHLYIGPYANMPMNNQNVPIPGQFPINMAVSDIQTITIAYPLGTLPSCYVVALHTEVHKMVNGTWLQSETGWGFGDPFPNTQRWGWTIPYCTKLCE